MASGADADEELNSNTPPSIKKTAQEASNSALVPTKSAKAYESTYSQFYKWFRGLDGVTETTKITESFLLTYFDVKVSKASAWSIYSRLKCKLREKSNTHDEKHLNAVEMYQIYLKMLPTGIKSDRVWIPMENGKIQDRPLGG